MARSVTGKGQGAMTSRCGEPEGRIAGRASQLQRYTNAATLGLGLDLPALSGEACPAPALVPAWGPLPMSRPPPPHTHIMIPSSWQRSGWSSPRFHILWVSVM